MVFPDHTHLLFITGYMDVKALFSSLVFICIKDSYSLTSLFVDGFCDAFRNIKFPYST